MENQDKVTYSCGHEELVRHEVLKFSKIETGKHHNFNHECYTCAMQKPAFKKKMERAYKAYKGLREQNNV